MATVVLTSITAMATHPTVRHGPTIRATHTNRSENTACERTEVAAREECWVGGHLVHNIARLKHGPD